MHIESGLEDKVLNMLKNADGKLAHLMGLEYLYFSKKMVSATLPVDERTKQPFGILHGGASVMLAESIASIGAWLNVDEAKFAAVGIEINANHIRSVKSGKVTGTAKPLHTGKRTQVWEVRIQDEKENLVCVSRCTLAVIEVLS